MEVIEVKEKAAENQFNQMPHIVYKYDGQWIAHLTQDIDRIFKPGSNIAFQKGKAARWILLDGSELVGRIAAFYQDHGSRIGGIGFYEALDDRQYAKALFDVAFRWLKDEGVEEVEALVNFGQRDKFWGVLTEGFHAPAYQDNYHPPYYQDHLLYMGFEPEFTQWTYRIDRSTFREERLKPIAERVMQSFRFDAYTGKSKERYAKDFAALYNRAWAGFEHFHALDGVQVLNMMKQMDPVVRPGFVQFAYDQDRPIGFFVNVYDINPLIRDFKGRFSWWQKLNLLIRLKGHQAKRIRGIVFGVDPDYHNRGIEASLIWNMYEFLKAYPGIEEAELSWIGDFNPKMLRLLEGIGAQKWKKHTTFKKALT